LLGPRMVIPTRWIHDGIDRPADWEAASGVLVTDEAQARQAVTDARNYGADFIELGGTEDIPRDAFFALADEAKKWGMPFAGHVPVSVSVAEASNVGLKSKEY